MQYWSISIRYTNEKYMHVDTAIAYPACNKYLFGVLALSYLLLL